jgi:hypothetical protein
MDVNWLAVFLAALSSFLLGGLWYSPLLFTKPWLRLSGADQSPVKPLAPPIMFGGAFALSFVAALVFAMFLGRHPGLPLGLGAGASAGLCWVAASFGINYLFERRPLGLWLINGGYHTLQFTLYGLVLGLMG